MSGLYHGLNPGMGWPLAVSAGLMERSSRALVAALWPLSDKLNEAINAGLPDPKLKARLADLGGAVLALSPTDFEKLIADETEKWGKVVKFTGIKAD